ncbi:MAG: phosphate ABC transporter substrate-binding protein PstS [Bryobacteraceae bacterium]|jgi:phosphate transport system substrate-binding protein
MKNPSKLAAAAMAALSFAGAAAAQSINAAGATFPEFIYKKWFSDYKNAHPGVEINYQAIGSGGGIKQLTQGTVDFGASDRPLTDAEMADPALKIKPIYFPTVLGGIVPAYNLPDVKTQLLFTGDVLAGIFLGKINKWNDPRIAALNKGVKLPADDIAVVHRSDGSGTTFVFTEYLAKVSPEWKAGPGVNQSPKWPTGMGQAQNEGVAGAIKQTPGSIGYVELTFILTNKGMQYGQVKNAAGSFINASVESVTAAAAGLTTFPASITNAPGPKAYPISTMTYLLIPSTIPDAKKREAVKGFLAWALKDGQKLAPPLGYAPLPKEVVAAELKQLPQVK